MHFYLSLLRIILDLVSTLVNHESLLFSDSPEGRHDIFAASPKHTGKKIIAFTHTTSPNLFIQPPPPVSRLCSYSKLAVYARTLMCASVGLFPGAQGSFFPNSSTARWTLNAPWRSVLAASTGVVIGSGVMVAVTGGNPPNHRFLHRCRCSRCRRLLLLQADQR